MDAGWYNCYNKIATNIESLSAINRDAISRLFDIFRLDVFAGNSLDVFRRLSASVLVSLDNKGHCYTLFFFAIFEIEINLLITLLHPIFRNGFHLRYFTLKSGISSTEDSIWISFARRIFGEICSLHVKFNGLWILQNA